MKKLRAFSFHLHWITLCCFLLPFFYDSCSTKKTEDIAEDSASVVVPANVSLNIEDSVSDESHPLDTVVLIPTDTAGKEIKNQKDELLSETVIKKYPILKPILIPDAGTLTGLATIVNSIQFLAFFAASITFLLLLIGLLAKLIDKNAIKTFLLLEISATTFLFLACPPFFFGHDKLWGYWLCIICISTLILLDTYIIYKQKRKEN